MDEAALSVEVTRGEVVESRHIVDAVVVDRNGPVVAWGDLERPVIPRSAIKFVQAIPLLRTGAAERFGVSEIELALACSSHSGEPRHVEAVRSWLDRIGLDERALECGPDHAIDDDAMAEVYRRGDGPAPILNCCSGKHAGFLTVARHLDVDHAGYIEPDHPVQRLVTDAIAELTGFPLGRQRPGRDGCGIPTFALPLAAIAASMARLTDPVDLAPQTQAVAAVLASVPEGRKFWISGTGRHEVVLGDAATGPLMAKGGAEGVFVAGLPERGLGVAVKARDGAGRAAQAGISAVLARLGVVPASSVEQPVTNKAGTEVGRLRVEMPDPPLDRLGA